MFLRLFVCSRSDGHIKSVLLLFIQSMSEEKYRPLTSRLLVGRPRWKLLFDEIGKSNKQWVQWVQCDSSDVTSTNCLSVVSGSELESSAVDRRASPGPSTDCVTQPDALKQPLSSTRSPSADRTFGPRGWGGQQLWDECFFYTFSGKYSSFEVKLWIFVWSWLLEILYKQDKSVSSLLPQSFIMRSDQPETNKRDCSKPPPTGEVTALIHTSVFGFLCWGLMSDKRSHTT